jgi:hypothetical protein
MWWPAIAVLIAGATEKITVIAAVLTGAPRGRADMNDVCAGGPEVAGE